MPMPAAPAAALIDLVLASTLGSTDQGAGNRVSLEGLTVDRRADGTLQVGAQAVTLASLRIVSGPLSLEVGQLALHELVAGLRVEDGRPHLVSVEAARAEVTGAKLEGPVARPAHGSTSHPAAGSWCLGPLAAADGTIRAEIVDAHLLFDADVTVPIRQGEVNFRDATVAHVGPDSRMGVSRLGIYVDAPNGRSYLFQFSSAPVAGVEYERRGALLGPWVTERGKLRLQPFGEALLRQSPAGQALGSTEQARLLFQRTAVSGELQLGDGRFAGPGVQVELVQRADGRNKVRFHSEAVGRGLTLEVPDLSVRHALLGASGTQLHCERVEGTVGARLGVEGPQMRFALQFPSLRISRLRLDSRVPLNFAAA